MARTRVSLLFVAVLLALSGCKAFFDFNAFSSLDKAAVPDPSRYQGVGGLSNLQHDLASQAIVNALKGAPATVDIILINLDNSYHLIAGPLATPDQQTAAILYSDLALRSTSGDVLVNNALANLMTQPPGNLQTLLSSIVPADVAADFTKFNNMMSELLVANTVYINLGNSAPLPVPGMNMGDVAQKAAVAYLMRKVYDAVNLVDPGNEISELFALVNNQPNNIAYVTTTPANPLNPLPGWLKNIFDAAGAPYPA